MSDWGERSNKAVIESFISGFHLKVQSFSFEKFNLEAQKGSLGLMQPCTLHSPEDFLEKLNSLFSQDRRGQSITSLWVTFPVLPSINQQHRLFFPRKSQNILLVSPQPRVSFPWLRILAARIISNHPVTLSRMERMITSRIKHNKILMIITETEKLNPRLFPNFQIICHHHLLIYHKIAFLVPLRSVLINHLC